MNAITRLVLALGLGVTSLGFAFAPAAAHGPLTAFAH